MTNMNETGIESRLNGYLENHNCEIQNARDNSQRKIDELESRKEKLDRNYERGKQIIQTKHKSIKRNYEHVKKQNEPKISVARNLQNSNSLLQLTDQENRHLIRILESEKYISLCYPHEDYIKHEAQKNFRVISGDAKWDRPQGGGNYNASIVENVLLQDEVYRNLQSMRERLSEKANSFGCTYSDIGLISNSDFKFYPQDVKKWKPEYTRIFEVLDDSCKFYLGLMEARKMDEEDYNSLKNNNHALNRTVSRFDAVVNNFDRKNLYDLEKIRREGGVMINHDLEKKMWPIIENSRRLSEAIVNGFNGYFVKKFGKSPYYKLEELRENIEPRAYDLEHIGF